QEVDLGHVRILQVFAVSPVYSQENVAKNGAWAVQEEGQQPLVEATVGKAQAAPQMDGEITGVATVMQGLDDLGEDSAFNPIPLGHGGGFDYQLHPLTFVGRCACGDEVHLFVHRPQAETAHAQRLARGRVWHEV